MDAGYYTTFPYIAVNDSIILHHTNKISNLETKSTINMQNTSGLSTPGYSNVSNVSIPENEKKIAPHSLEMTFFIGILLGAMIIGTVIGNVLVCMAVAIVPKLRTPSNLLIVSLAVADLLVALLVMPIALMTLLKKHWILGNVVCDIWVSLDVMLCTASILNLCMISVDRYFAITRPLRYAIKRTPARMAAMIVIVWTTSAVISVPPLFYFKNENDGKICQVSRDIAYQIYATCCAFYLPLTIMIGVYYQIYSISLRLAAKETQTKYLTDHYERNRLLNEKGKTEENCNYKNGGESAIHKNKMANEEHVMVSCRQAVGIRKCIQMCSSCFECDSTCNGEGRHMCAIRKIRSHHSHHHHRETKAIKTLGVIMGCFTICWLPFFILAIIRPIICDSTECPIPNWLNEICLWLGYANSFLNPLIYARFNRDFRTPFKSILCLECNKINKRLRKESYVEQYGLDHSVAFNSKCVNTVLTNLETDTHKSRVVDSRRTNSNDATNTVILESGRN